MLNANQSHVLRVISLEIKDDGTVIRKNMAIDRDSQLENTLLQADYPDVRVATIDIPQEQLDEYQQAMVERSLGKKIEYDGVQYVAGASASAKNGKYYAVDTKHADRIAKRFRYWPEAAMTYFGILVSPCKARLEFPNARVIVVKDHELGTNDCQAVGSGARCSKSSVSPAADSTSSACPSPEPRQKVLSRCWKTM